MWLQYYKALYGKQIGALLKGVDAKNLPNMRNLAMELRKLCCHPVRMQYMMKHASMCSV